MLDRLIDARMVTGMDVLSDAISVMGTGRPTSTRLRVGSPWRYTFAPYDGAGFHVVVRGTGWLLAEASEPVALGTGDVVLLPRGSAHVLSDGPDARGAVPFEQALADPRGTTEFLCGKYRLDRSRTHPVLAQLPEIVHIPNPVGRHPELRAAIDLLGAEVTTERPGRHAVLSGLLDLLLVYLVRAWLADQPGAGWPQALSDPEIAAVLAALHTEPGAPWRMTELAERAGLSRATLARRFTALTGQPPMTYLTWWRMTTAARLLRDTDQPLPAIARQVGYGSPFAFSHAFTRQFGLAPGRYRANPIPA
jgi:AraC-like DNA-binding protein